MWNWKVQCVRHTYSQSCWLKNCVCYFQSVLQNEFAYSSPSSLTHSPCRGHTPHPHSKPTIRKPLEFHGQGKGVIDMPGCVQVMCSVVIGLACLSIS